jgi:nitroreductase
MIPIKNTFDSIMQRRAVKYFDAGFSIPENEFNKIIDLARNTPSSFNIQHWRIVRVVDKGIRSEIRKAAWDQVQITDASELLIICADIKAFEKQPERYWENAPEPVRNYLVPMIKPFYDGKEQLQRDEAMRSVGFIGQTIMLASQAMGYDSCPMIGFDHDAVSKIINLPSDHALGMIIVIGKGVRPAHPKGGYLPLDIVLKKDKF